MTLSQVGEKEKKKEEVEVKVGGGGRQGGRMQAHPLAEKPKGKADNCSFPSLLPSSVTLLSLPLSPFSPRVSLSVCGCGALEQLPATTSGNKR